MGVALIDRSRPMRQPYIVKSCGSCLLNGKMWLTCCIISKIHYFCMLTWSLNCTTIPNDIIHTIIHVIISTVYIATTWQLYGVGVAPLDVKQHMIHQ